METRHILFSVAGGTPAVITESLYGLLTRGIDEGDIQILTTSFGRRAMQVLLEEDGQVAAFNRAYGTRWAIAYDHIEALTREPSRPGDTQLGAGPQPLDDLRTTPDNLTAANRIVARVRTLTEQDDCVLHASVAGGRKTLGLFLYQAMSWFARPQDDLSHVLVAEHFEQDRGFFFPDPANRAHHDIIDFSLLPFVRMRGLMPELWQDPSYQYEDLVQLSQIHLNDTVPEPSTVIQFQQVDGQHLLIVDDYPLARLTPLAAGLYLFLCRHANLAREQEPFHFREAWAYRDALATCLEATSGGQLPRDGGLASLGSGHPEEYPWQWQSAGAKPSVDGRQTDLNNAFTRLNKALEPLWRNASFRVHYSSSKKSDRGPARWVDIPPERLHLPDA